MKLNPLCGLLIFFFCYSTKQKKREWLDSLICLLIVQFQASVVHTKQTNSIVFSLYCVQRTPKASHTHTYTYKIIINFSFLSTFIRIKSTSERLSHEMWIIHNRRFFFSFASQMCACLLFFCILSSPSHDMNIFVEYINCQRLKFIYTCSIA